MSELSIFSLLVVGRALPLTFIPTSGADYRPIDRRLPLAQQRETFRAKTPDAGEDVPLIPSSIVS